MRDTLRPDRIVLGVQVGSRRAEAAIRELTRRCWMLGVPFLADQSDRPRSW